MRKYPYLTLLVLSTLVAIAVMVLCAPILRAAPLVPATAPAFSAKRVTATLQGTWQWWTPEGSVAGPSGPGEFVPRATLGYSFKTLTLGASEGYGIHSGLGYTALGIRIGPIGRTDSTQPIVTVGADYVAYGASKSTPPPVVGGEAVASINAALPQWSPYITPVGSVGYGLTSHLFNARVGLSAVVFKGDR